MLHASYIYGSQHTGNRFELAGHLCSTTYCRSDVNFFVSTATRWSKSRHNGLSTQKTTVSYRGQDPLNVNDVYGSFSADFRPFTAVLGIVLSLTTVFTCRVDSTGIPDVSISEITSEGGSEEDGNDVGSGFSVQLFKVGSWSGASVVASYLYACIWLRFVFFVLYFERQRCTTCFITIWRMSSHATVLVTWSDVGVTSHMTVTSIHITSFRYVATTICTHG